MQTYGSYCLITDVLYTVSLTHLNDNGTNYASEGYQQETLQPATIASTRCIFPALDLRRAVLAMSEMSVRPSVKLAYIAKTKETSAHILYHHPSFSTVGRPFVIKIVAKLTRSFTKTPIFNGYSLVASQSINQSINQHELAMAPHIQSSGAPEIQWKYNSITVSQ